MSFDPATLVLPDRGQPARTIHLVAADGYDTWLAGQPLRRSRGARCQRG